MIFWRHRIISTIVSFSLFALLHICCCHAEENEPSSALREDPHRDPTLCEVCKFLTTELKERLAETDKTKEIIETGYSFDEKKKKKKAYNLSELRFIEALTDPHVCDKILQYNVHAERDGSNRFAKDKSETMETLQGLVDKGVKVELGIPYELWDTPSASVTEMQRQCFKIVENYEDQLEEWYFNNQQKDLTEFLCVDSVLKEDNRGCLNEKWQGKQKKAENDSDDEEDDDDQQREKKHKGDDGTRTQVKEEL